MPDNQIVIYLRLGFSRGTILANRHSQSSNTQISFLSNLCERWDLHVSVPGCVMRCGLFRVIRLLPLAAIISISNPHSVMGQKPSAGGGQAGQQTTQGGQAGQAGGASGGGQGLPGLSYSPSEWPSLILPGVKGSPWTYKEGRAVVCYRLARGNNSTQPFILEPVENDEIQSSGFYRPCGDHTDAEVDREGQETCKRLKAEQSKVSKLPESTEEERKKKDKKIVDDTHWSACSELKSNTDPLQMNQILVVGVDVSDVGELGINVDQLKLLNINVTNQQGSPINASPLRASFPGTTATGGGGSQQGSTGAYADSSGKGHRWLYAGTRPPGGKYPRRWEENHVYQKGDAVTDSSGLHFFTANGIFNSGTKPTDPFPSEPRVERILDGDVIWQEMEPPGPNVTTTYWKTNTWYRKGAIVCAGRGKKTDETPSRNLLEQFSIGALDISPNSRETASLGPRPEVFSNTVSADDQIPVMPAQQGGSCEFAQTQLNNSSVDHLHYYFAVKEGTSGTPPPYPLSLQLIPRAIYLAWPYQLPGDVIPTFNVSLVYTPPTPGAIWQGNTFYPAGGVVIPRKNNGHYYSALTGGFSALAPNEPDFPIDTPDTVADGTLQWLDAGTSSPTVPASPGAGTAQSAGGGGGGGGGGQGNAAGSAASKPQLWFPNTHYLLGDTILNPDNGHYYTAIAATAGFSSPKPTAQNDPFPSSTSQPQFLIDGQVQWLLTNTANGGGWLANHTYSLSNPMMAANGAHYVMTGSSATSGKSGSSAQIPATPTVNARQPDGTVIWMYAPNGTAVDYWQQSQAYALGQSVKDQADNVYVVIGVTSGLSGSIDPTIANGAGQPATVPDGDLIWADLGLGTPRQPDWKESHKYLLADLARGSNGHDYRVVHLTAGISGTDKPQFPVVQSQTLVDPKTVIPDSQGALTWRDLGEARPLDVPIDQLSNWKAHAWYHTNDTIFVPGVGNGRYYRAQNDGQSGDFSPFLNLSQPFPITWQDAGTTPPASVASGQPADQNVSLINLTLPQSHTLSYFNIAAGVVVGVKHPPTFGFVPASSYTGTLPTGYTAATGTISLTPSSSVAGDPVTGCTITVPYVKPTTPPPATNPNLAYACPEQTSTGPIPVDPVLVLTGYIVPVDAERPMRFKGNGAWRDYLPAPSLGISLANPTTNFYVGASSEALVRNLEVFYGVSFHNTALRLAPGSSQPLWGGVGTAPTAATASGFQKGPFIGVTFNLSGFIQSLFGGGGGAAKP